MKGFCLSLFVMAVSTLTATTATFDGPYGNAYKTYSITPIEGGKPWTIHHGRVVGSKYVPSECRIPILTTSEGALVSPPVDDQVYHIQFEYYAASKSDQMVTLYLDIPERQPIIYSHPFVIGKTYLFEEILKEPIPRGGTFAIRCDSDAHIAIPSITYDVAPPLEISFVNYLTHLNKGTSRLISLQVKGGLEPYIYQWTLTNFEGDEIFNKSDDKIQLSSSLLEGRYTLTCMLQDNLGRQDICSKTLYVVGGTRGFIRVMDETATSATLNWEWPRNGVGVGPRLELHQTDSAAPKAIKQPLTQSALLTSRDQLGEWTIEVSADFDGTFPYSSFSSSGFTTKAEGVYLLSPILTVPEGSSSRFTVMIEEADGALLKPSKILYQYKASDWKEILPLGNSELPTAIFMLIGVQSGDPFQIKLAGGPMKSIQVFGSYDKDMALRRIPLMSYQKEHILTGLLPGQTLYAHLRTINGEIATPVKIQTKPLSPPINVSQTFTSITWDNVAGIPEGCKTLIQGYTLRKNSIPQGLCITGMYESGSVKLIRLTNLSDDPIDLANYALAKDTKGNKVWNSKSKLSVLAKDIDAVAKILEPNASITYARVSKLEMLPQGTIYVTKHAFFVTGDDNVALFYQDEEVPYMTLLCPEDSTIVLDEDGSWITLNVSDQVAVTQPYEMERYTLVPVGEPIISDATVRRVDKILFKDCDYVHLYAHYAPVGSEGQDPYVSSSYAVLEMDKSQAIGLGFRLLLR